MNNAHPISKAGNTIKSEFRRRHRNHAHFQLIDWQLQ